MGQHRWSKYTYPYARAFALSGRTNQYIYDPHRRLSPTLSQTILTPYLTCAPSPLYLRTLAYSQSHTRYTAQSSTYQSRRLRPTRMAPGIHPRALLYPSRSHSPSRSDRNQKRRINASLLPQKLGAHLQITPSTTSGYSLLYPSRLTHQRPIARMICATIRAKVHRQKFYSAFTDTRRSYKHFFRFIIK